MSLMFCKLDEKAVVRTNSVQNENENFTNKNDVYRKVRQGFQ